MVTICSSGRPVLLKAAQHGANAAGKLARAERLGHIVVRAQVQPLDAVVLVRAHGEHDHRRVADLADALERLEAVHAGHFDVEQHQVRVVVAHLLQRLHAVVGFERKIAFQVQVHLDEAHHARFVVNDEDLFLGLVGHGVSRCKDRCAHVWRTVTV